MMVQQTQPVNQQAQPAATQNAGKVQPMEGGTSIWAKWWIWAIVAVVVIGIGIYFFLM